MVDARRKQDSTLTLPLCHDGLSEASEPNKMTCYQNLQFDPKGPIEGNRMAAGMNLSPLPVETTEAGFWAATFGSVGCGLLILIIFIAYACWKKILLIPN